VRDSAGVLGLQTVEPGIPYPWSEDFGRFSGVARCALFGIGAGERQADLHTPDYDFPDDITETALLMFISIMKGLLHDD
jgi:metal-dependent amidase/aminoacylase/carboxypeptidase family protein